MKVIFKNRPHCINTILTYGAHLNPELKKYLFHDGGGYNKSTYTTFSAGSRPNVIRLKLPEGKSEFPYREFTIQVEYIVLGEIVGCGAGPDYVTEVSLEADMDFDNFNNLWNDAIYWYNSGKNKDEIITFIHTQGHWTRLSKLPKRKLDTIYLPKKSLEKTIKDVKKFINNKKLYSDLCVPYKRNYLFEGIPGSGKTSLIFAIASKFNKNIAIMNFNLDVDDATFMKAISRLPDDSILVLEDIDTLFVERKGGDSNKSMISFSGLLNTLDGIAHKEGQMTFLTTNYITKLDKALIRPGRIDNILKFTYATLGQIQIMYNKFFPDKREKWKEFKKKIKGVKTTIATLQSFFFLHIDGDIIKFVDELKKMSRECIESENKKLYI